MNFRSNPTMAGDGRIIGSAVPSDMRQLPMAGGSLIPSIGVANIANTNNPFI
jgi:hypothetical protein